jgi:hypothetical protein
MTTVFVDLAVNILLTSLFLWPLWQSKFLSVNIRRVASRTLVYVSFISSFHSLGLLPTGQNADQVGNWPCSRVNRAIRLSPFGPENVMRVYPPPFFGSGSVDLRGR